MRFDRRAIVNAHVLRAVLDHKEIKLSHAARDLCDVSLHLGRSGESEYQVLREGLDGLELEDVVCFFVSLRARQSACPPEMPLGPLSYAAEVNAGGAICLADAYARIHDPAGVEINLSNSDDDPTRIDATIHDPIAEAWVDVHGSQQGSTWEGTGDPGFVYDSWTWHPKLIEELQAEGLNLDQSDYSEPDERDIAIAEHAANCDICQCDWRRAAEHFDDPLVILAHDAASEEDPSC